MLMSENVKSCTSELLYWLLENSFSNLITSYSSLEFSSTGADGEVNCWLAFFLSTSVSLFDACTGGGAFVAALVELPLAVGDAFVVGAAGIIEC